MMVTRGVTFPVRIKFLLIFEYAILSAFSLITDDGKINYDVTPMHHINTALQEGMREKFDHTPDIKETIPSSLDLNLSEFDLASRSISPEVTKRRTNLSSTIFLNLNDSGVSNKTDVSKKTVNDFNLGEYKTFESQKIKSTDQRSVVTSNERKIPNNISHSNKSVESVDPDQNNAERVKLLPPKLDREQFKDQKISQNVNEYHLPLPNYESSMQLNTTKNQIFDSLAPMTSEKPAKLSSDFSGLKNVSEQLMRNSTKLFHLEPKETTSPITELKSGSNTFSIQSNIGIQPFIDESEHIRNLTGFESKTPVKIISLELENSIISSNPHAEEDIALAKARSENSIKLSDTHKKNKLTPFSSDSKNFIKVPNLYIKNYLRSASSNSIDKIKASSPLEKGDDALARISLINTFNLTTAGNVTDDIKRPESKEQSETNIGNKSLTLKLAISPQFENGTFANISHRRSKEFISEETLMESRNYNYDPAYPSYAQPVHPSGSGEEAYHPFATITREAGWYQDPTYPTLTTAKTPRAPQFPSPPHRWRLPLWYRARLRGYPKEEAFYDYLEDEELHRWSQPSAPASSVSPIRPEFHRYHEGGGGGYDYSPSYDFAHVHEHGGHTETTSKIDFSKIGLLLLLKLAIAKLKALGALQILLLLLLKAKLLLAMMALKFFMVLKAMKLLKYLIAPLLLSSLLPLLLMIPMSLLSALLPLLMNLTPMNPEDPEPPPDIPDVPDEPDTPDMPDMGGRRKKRKHHKSRGLGEIQRLLRSDDCLQRMACELAARKQLAIVPIIVAWSLKKLASMLPIPIVKAYAKAYSNGRQMDKSPSGCYTKYRCNFLRKRS